MRFNDCPVAIVLGGTNPHVTLVNKLKERGYYTVLVDYLDDPPAKKAADEHVRESTLAKEKVLEIAKAYGASMIITTNIDQANVTACYVAEKMGIKPPYSYETSLNVTDKTRMKRIMWDNGIPTSHYIVAETADEARGKMCFPVIVKPADSNGSRGIHRADNNEELAHFFDAAKAASRNGKVIVEEFVSGTEVSFYYFVQDGIPYFINGCHKYKFDTVDDDVIQTTCVVYPASISKAAYECLHKSAFDIAKAFGLRDTPLFIQAIVDGDCAYVLEFAPRLGGGLSFRVMERDCGFDLQDAAINSFTGEKTDIRIKRPDYFTAILNIYSPGIIVGDITGVEDILEKNMATEFYRYRMRGSETSNDMSSGSRPGAYLIHGSSVDELKKKILYINDNMEVYDINGKASMRHDVFDVWKE